MDSDEIGRGCIGSPLQGLQMTLINWNEVNYRVMDKPYPRGEIVIGRGNVTTGHCKMPTKELETRKTFQGTPKKDDRQVSKQSGAESGKPLVPISSPISVTTLPAPPSSSPPIPAGGTKRKNYQIGGFQAEKKAKTMLSKKKTETVSCSESVVPHQKGGVQQNKKSTRGRTRRVSNTETPSKAVIKETMGPALKFVGEVENRDEISDL